MLDGKFYSNIIRPFTPDIPSLWASWLCTANSSVPGQTTEHRRACRGKSRTEDTTSTCDPSLEMQIPGWAVLLLVPLNWLASEKLPNCSHTDLLSTENLFGFASPLCTPGCHSHVPRTEAIHVTAASSSGSTGWFQLLFPHMLSHKFLPSVSVFAQQGEISESLCRKSLPSIPQLSLTDLALDTKLKYLTAQSLYKIVFD